MNGFRKAAAVAAAAATVAVTGTVVAAQAQPTAVHAVSVRFFVVGAVSQLDVVFAGQFRHSASFADGTFLQVPYRAGRIYSPVAVYKPGGWLDCTLSVQLSDGHQLQLVTKSSKNGVCEATGKPVNTAGTQWTAS